MGDCGQRLLWGPLTLSSKLMCSSITRLPETEIDRQTDKKKEEVFLDTSFHYQRFARAFPAILSEKHSPPRLEFAAVSSAGLVLGDKIKNWKVGPTQLIVTGTCT